MTSQTPSKKLVDQTLGVAGPAPKTEAVAVSVFSANDLMFIDKELMAEYDRRLAPVFLYLAAAEEPADLLNEAARPMLFSKLSFGLRKAGEALAWALFQHTKAQVDAKSAGGVAATAEFGQWVEGRRQEDEKYKPTEPQREHFMHTSETWRTANTKVAATAAMVEQLKTMKLEFMMAISTLKAIAYGGKDSDLMSGASIQVGDGT